MSLEKQLLLPISIGRVIRPPPNHLESIILQRERLFIHLCSLCLQSCIWTSHKHLIPTVQHGGGGLMIWACFAATGPGQQFNSSVYQSILESNVRPSDRQLKLGWNWVINRTMIPNTAADLQENVWKRKESRCCNDPVKVQLSTWLKYRGGTIRDLCIDKCPQTSVNWSKVVKKSGQKKSPEQRETDNVQKTSNSRLCCKRWFWKLLNHGHALTFSHTAFIYGVSFFFILCSAVRCHIAVHQRLYLSNFQFKILRNRWFSYISSFY